jgi:predicted transposase YdaD
MKDRLQLDKKDLLTLFIFMDHMIKLESQYQQEFNQEIKNWEGGTMITYEDELKQEARKEGREEGREEGRKEGREEGRKEGLQEGKREGRQEGLREGKIEITRNLIKLGSSLDFIKKATGLSEKKILEIKEELEKE